MQTQFWSITVKTKCAGEVNWYD